MHFHIITLFPDCFRSYIESSIIARAVEKKKIQISFYNPRDFTRDKHRRVDRMPYGGGPGMVLEPESVVRAVEKAKGRKKNVKIIFLSPGGKLFSNAYAVRATRKYTDIIILCGRYEGIDARVKKIFKAEEISVGPFVLTGGELAALIMIDVIARRIPGVLGTYESLEEERTASSEVYTRPEVFIYRGKKYRVPKVLLSGNHKKIEAWRVERAHNTDIDKTIL